MIIDSQAEETLRFIGIQTCYVTGEIQQAGKCYSNHYNCLGSSFTAESHLDCCCKSGGLSFHGPAGCFTW